MEAAEAFLRAHSFRDLTVDALMATTEHTRTVFYRHFDDIPALVLAMINEIGAELVDVAREWAASARVTPDEARGRLASFVDFYVRNGSLVHSVAEAAHHDEQVEQAYTGMIEGFVAMTTSAIEERMASGDLDPIDAPEVARALVRMLSGYLDDTLGREGRSDPERVLKTVTTIWSRTLFPGTDA